MNWPDHAKRRSGTAGDRYRHVARDAEAASLRSLIRPA